MSRLAIDGGTPVRTEPLDFSKGAALLGAEEADALAAVIAGRSLFRYKGGLASGTVAEFERVHARQRCGRGRGRLAGVGGAHPLVHPSQQGVAGVVPDLREAAGDVEEDDEQTDARRTCEVHRGEWGAGP